MAKTTAVKRKAEITARIDQIQAEIEECREKQRNINKDALAVVKKLEEDKHREVDRKISELRDKGIPVNEKTIEGIRRSSSILAFNKRQSDVIEKAQQRKSAREEDIKKLEVERNTLLAELESL